MALCAGATGNSAICSLALARTSPELQYCGRKCGVVLSLVAGNGRTTRTSSWRGHHLNFEDRGSAIAWGDASGVEHRCGGVGLGQGSGAVGGLARVLRRRELIGRAISLRCVKDRNQLWKTNWSEMATMAVPRSLIEDTSTEAQNLVDVEAPAQDGYGTFGDRGSMNQGDVSCSKQTQLSKAFTSWDSTTASLADSATAAFLLLQLPQIFLNTQNILAGNYQALFAVPWMGQLTGLLGNLSLLSYFASKKERGAMVVQGVGVISTLVVLSQLAIAGSMPFPAFAVTATAVVIGLTVNFLNYQSKLSPGVWRLWGEVVSIGGVTVLPQVMWSTFEPYLPHSVLPGAFCGGLAVTAIALSRLDKLPPKMFNFMGTVSAWTATLLFMWAPVAQMWSNYLNPSNIKGLSIFTVLLAMLGNGMLLPRALFTRDLMWFTGSSWGVLLQGWGVLLSMYIYHVLNDVTFWGVTAGLALWLGTMLVKDAKAFSLSSPISPLIELISGKYKS